MNQLDPADRQAPTEALAAEVTRLPKPMTSGLEARGRFGKQDFVYLSDEDAYRCPAGENGAIGPMRAAALHSKLAAQPARNGGLRAGSMACAGRSAEAR
jgi:hypothetical protein